MYKRKKENVCIGHDLQLAFVHQQALEHSEAHNPPHYDCFSLSTIARTCQLPIYISIEVYRQEQTSCMHFLLTEKG